TYADLEEWAPAGLKLAPLFLPPCDLGFQRAQLRLPEGPEPVQPHIDLPQGFGIDRINPPLPVHPHTGEAGVPQHPQMLRYGGLRDPEFALDHLDDLSGPMLAHGEHLQYA